MNEKANREQTEKENLEDIECDRRTMENLKESINAFLWSNLPGHVTIRAADKIACEIYEIINKATGATE